MGLFDLFKKRKAIDLSQDNAVNNLPEINKEDFVDDSDPNDNKVYIKYGTGMPIDLIYGLIKEDNEQKGYEDAICNPDISYKDMNMSLIRSTLEVKFKQVILKYEDDLREIEFHIQSRSQAGLVDIVEQLKTKKTTLLKHIDILRNMEKDLAENIPYMLGTIMSYQRGFLRGLAALSLETVKSKHNEVVD